MKPSPDIFNDVLGPVMTGPSSSHTAGPARIGRLVYDLCGGIVRAEILYSRTGSYAATLHGQASDRGFAAGLLGLSCDDPRLPRALDLAREKGVDIAFRGVDEPLDHPNRAVLLAAGPDGLEHRIESLSVGGGNIRITAVDGAAAEIDGRRGVYVSLEKGLLVSDRPFGPAGRLLRAVTPVESDPGRRPPFRNAAEAEERLPSEATAGQAALLYESALSGWDESRMQAHLDGLLGVMEESVRGGLALRDGSRFEYVKPSAAGLSERRAAFLPSGLLDEGVVIAAAVMEHDRAMGVIAAAPTAGSAGVLPAVLLPLVHSGRLNRSGARRALAGAGLIGAFVLESATFAAEEAGCQAENGAASAMAAAALCDVQGAPAAVSFRAAALALSNLLGLICDPVGGGVEIPCLGRNAAAAANAVVSANLALGGFDPLIPLDEVIGAMAEVGRALPASLRCTARGGLAATPTALRLTRHLREGVPRS
jgi:L-serine dehydratase